MISWSHGFRFLRLCGFSAGTETSSFLSLREVAFFFRAGLRGQPSDDERAKLIYRPATVM